MRTSTKRSRQLPTPRAPERLSLPVGALAGRSRARRTERRSACHGAGGTLSTSRAPSSRRAGRSRRPRASSATSGDAAASGVDERSCAASGVVERSGAGANERAGGVARRGITLGGGATVSPRGASPNTAPHCWHRSLSNHRPGVWLLQKYRTWASWHASHSPGVLRVVPQFGHRKATLTWARPRRLGRLPRSPPPRPVPAAETLL